MKLLIPLLFLLLTACSLSPAAEERFVEHQGHADRLEALAEGASPEVRQALLSQAQEHRQEASRIKAQDYGHQTGFLWELIALVTGTGGVVGGAIGRYFATHGKSRASEKVDDLQKKLDDLQDLVDHFQEGMVNPGPPTIREAA